MFEPHLLDDEQYLKIVGPLNATSAPKPSALRRFPRFAVAFVVKGQGLDEAWLPVGVSFKGATMNISRGGILFNTDVLVGAPFMALELLDSHEVLAPRTIRVFPRGKGMIGGQFAGEPDRSFFNEPSGKCLVPCFPRGC